MSHPIAHIDPEDPKLPEDPIDDFPEDHEFIPSQDDIEEEDALNQDIELLKSWEKTKQEFVEETTIAVAEEFPSYVQKTSEALDGFINYYTKKLHAKS